MPPSLAPAARLRDELHAVTNRVSRLLTEPGAQLSSVTIEAPTAIASAASHEVLIELLRMACDRLAQLIESAPRDAPNITGCVAEGTVTIAELVRVPLHHSHRDLAAGPSDGAVVAQPRFG